MGMREDLEQMGIAALPLRPAVTLLPGTSVGHAIELLSQNRVGCAFTVDEDGRPAGRFGESTVLRLAARGRVPLEAPVFDFLSPVGEWIGYHDPVTRLIELIRHSGERSICVVDRRGRLAGLADPGGINEFVASYLFRHSR